MSDIEWTMTELHETALILENQIAELSKLKLVSISPQLAAVNEALPYLRQQLRELLA